MSQRKTTTHLQIHNVWPMLMAGILFIASYVNFQRDFKELQQRFLDYKVVNEKKMEFYNDQIAQLQTRLEQVTPKSVGNVQGVSTSSGTVRRTPTVTPTPTIKP